MHGIFKQNKNEIMRVLCILPVYNEMEFLPLKIEFCKQNKLELYIIDNMSTDGSWEWLQENNIPSHRLDTNESFDLRKLQSEQVRTVHKLKPDWVIFNGCDLFPLTLKPLHDVLQKLDKQGYNRAKILYAMFNNTGENPKTFDPFNTYFYYQPKRILTMICKYSPHLKYQGDNVLLPNPKGPLLDGIMVNYGNTKSKKERNETLKRRRKAWKNGLNRNFGGHYRRGAKNNWIKSKESLKDIRKNKYAPYIKKLQEMSDKLKKLKQNGN